MSSKQLDVILAALAASRTDRDSRQNLLDRVSFDMLKRPALGAQMVARLCMMQEETPELRDLDALLGTSLDVARIARENGNTSGARFLKALEDAVKLADGQGKLGPQHRLMLARAWVSHGLQAPAALETPVDGSDDEGAQVLPEGGPDAIVADLFQGLMKEAGDSALDLHNLLIEAFPAMPVELRHYIIAWSAAQPEPIHARLACLWLLNPAAELRRMAAEGLMARLKRGALPEGILADLVVLRSWLPQDEARTHVDHLLRDALRSDVAASAPSTAWSILSILATLPDGGGAQTCAVTLQSGRRRSIAMLLVKQGHGVKDAYVMSDLSAREHKQLMQQLRGDLGALEVNQDYLLRTLSMALADGLDRGLPPAPGLIEVADACGFGALRPQPADRDAMLAGLASFPRIAGLPARERDKLVKASRAWVGEIAPMMGWFDDTDEVRETLDSTSGVRAAHKALWDWLETRRAWWARILASSAMVLEAAGQPQADSLVASALALKDGADLKKIPVMAEIHRLTYAAQDQADDAFDPDEEEFGPPSEPEKKGEFARLLHGTALTADWIEGYLMAIILAPKDISPQLWASQLIQKVITGLEPARLQRFIDIVMMRGDTLYDLVDDPGAVRASLAKGSEQRRREWAQGFTECQGFFRTSWPARAMNTADRAILRVVADAARAEGALDLEAVGSWIADRYVRSRGS